MKNNLHHNYTSLKPQRLLWFCILGILIVSCQSDRKDETVKEDVSYKLYRLKGTGWKAKSITHFVNDIHYKATEVPLAYYFLKNQGQNGLLAVDSLLKAHRDERVIEFEFMHRDQKDILEKEYTHLDYDKSVKYMATTIRNDFMVVTASGDTIPCAGVHFERHFKVSPFNRVLLYFGGINPEDNIQLIYQDRLFQNGIFKFKFDEIPFKT